MLPVDFKNTFANYKKNGLVDFRGLEPYITFKLFPTWGGGEGGYALILLNGILSRLSRNCPDFRGSLHPLMKC